MPPKLETEPNSANETINPRERKSFDPLAAVITIRYDINAFGQILPETREQIYNEELTFVAEGINLPLRTEFEIKEVDGEQVYFTRGEWRSYDSMLETGLEAAKIEAAADPRKLFLVDWAVRDQCIADRFKDIKPGESIAWASPYPYDEEEKTGPTFLEKECGLQPKRKMAFLYRASRSENGRLFLESHSVDNSDDEALQAALQEAQTPDHNMHSMLAANDAKMSEKYSGEYKAGREAGGEVEQNAWDIIQQNGNLVKSYFSELEELAYSGLEGAALENRKNRLTYGFWGAIKLRIDKVQASPVLAYSQLDYHTAQQGVAQAELQRAFNHFQAKGEQLIGCGGSLSFSLEVSSPETASDLIFGKAKNIEEESWHGGTIKHGTCVNCKEDKKVGVKSWCRDCIKC